MALRNDINAEVKADLIAYSSAVDGQGYLVYGDMVRGDSPLRFYYYASSSSATPDGELVLPATGMGGIGRFIKSPILNVGAGLNYNLSTDTFTNTITNNNQLSNGAGYITGINSSNVTTALGYTPVNPSSLATVASTGAYSDLGGKPSLATVATTGAYSDLTGKPTIPSAQIQSDWSQASSGSADFIKNKPGLSTVATSGAYSDLSGKPTIPSAQQAYQGTALRSPAFPFFKSVTVGSGVAVFQLTTDGTAGGTTIFPNGVITESVNAFVSDALASYQMSYAFTNSNKTLTVTANKLTTANILTGILGQAAANGASVNLQIWGY